MGGSKSKARIRRERSRGAWELARRQHGVVAHGQLVALGFTAKAIKHRLGTGRLHRMMRGVYAVGRGELSREGRWMAAVLACGEGAALSHGSAAALWGIGREQGLVEVTVRRRCRHRRRGLSVRSRPALPAGDVTVHRRIPVTSPPRTILDQAAEPISDSRLERLVNEADALDLIDPDSLRRFCSLRTGEPGVGRLRRLLDRHTFRLSDSELERLFRPLAAAAGLPVPETRALVNGFQVDFYWPDLGLVVETDSLRYHRTAAKQSRDVLRDQAHAATGLTTLRFTHRQVRYEPAQVKSILRSVASLARSRRP